MKLYDYGKITMELQHDLDKTMLNYHYGTITKEEADHRADVALLHFKERLLALEIEEVFKKC